MERIWLKQYPAGQYFDPQGPINKGICKLCQFAYSQTSINDYSVWDESRVPTDENPNLLKGGELPLVALVRDDAVAFDVRCVPEAAIVSLASAVAAALKRLDSGAAGEAAARPEGDASGPEGATLED